MTFEELMFKWKLFEEPKYNEEERIEAFDDFLRKNKSIIDSILNIKGASK